VLSVYNSDAEKTLDAEIVKICDQTCISASDGTERKDQIRVLQTKTHENFSKCLDSGARFIKSASDGTERKDQIRIPQTKTYEKFSKCLDSGARFIKSASDGAECKDQIRVLQTKTYEFFVST